MLKFAKCSWQTNSLVSDLSFRRAVYYKHKAAHYYDGRAYFLSLLVLNSVFADDGDAHHDWQAVDAPFMIVETLIFASLLCFLLFFR